jgi:hypothetical protein
MAQPTKQQNGIRGGCGCLAVLAIGAFLWMLSTPSPEKRAADQEKEREIGVYTICQQAVRGRLKAPSTASFPWALPKFSFTPDGGDRFISYVDAQNGFGAQIRTYYTARFLPRGIGRCSLILSKQSA